MREDAPKLATIEDMVRKNEQVFDALDRGSVTPKTAEQLNQTLKAIFRLRIDTPIRLMSLLAKHRGAIPIPRDPIVRKMIGLGPDVDPGDAVILKDAMVRLDE